MTFEEENIVMKKHFVTFLSPGTFFAESSSKAIDSWDVKKALEMSKTVEERYNATPYAFYFTTYGRSEDELNSHEIDRSGTYYIGDVGKVETLDEIKSRHDPKEDILVSNMEINDWNKVFTTTKGWKWTQPLGENDQVVYSS